MEAEKPTTLTCAVVAIDHKNLCYKVCSTCERILPGNTTSSTSLCKHCNPNNAAFDPITGSKRLYRLLVSIATDTKVFVVICFDRTARIVFGCSADEFFDFAKYHPFAAETAGMILEGEMFRMTLSKPKNGNAQHLRVVSVIPLRSGFKPVIDILKNHYGVRAAS